jgi:hypothetical protein
MVIAGTCPAMTEQSTLSALGGRPVDLAAEHLVDEFGVAINVEDPVGGA